MIGSPMEPSSLSVTMHSSLVYGFTPVSVAVAVALQAWNVSAAIAVMAISVIFFFIDLVLVDF